VTLRELRVDCCRFLPNIIDIRARQVIAVKGIRNAKVAIICLTRNQAAILKLRKAKIAIYELTLEKVAIRDFSTLEITVYKNNIFKDNIFVLAT
jgi:hypothetical protein